jgi:hypothetical protein
MIEGIEDKLNEAIAAERRAVDAKWRARLAAPPTDEMEDAVCGILRVVQSGHGTWDELWTDAEASGLGHAHWPVWAQPASNKCVRHAFPTKGELASLIWFLMLETLLASTGEGK